MAEKYEMSYDGGYQDQPQVAELYDLMTYYNKRGDVKFYTEYCSEISGEVLELGCGTGRILIPIAQSGQKITGLDLSDHMLNQCRAKLEKQADEVAQRVRLVQADMTQFKIGRFFELIIIPFRPFQHLISVEDQISCLRSIHDHLTDSGRLIIDFFQVDMKFMSSIELSVEVEDMAEVELADGRKLRRSHRIVALHPARQFNDVEMIYYLTDTDGKIERIVQAFPFRYFFRYEVEHLLHRCGFTIVELYGDMDKSPLTDGSPEMIFVAEKIS